jgi:hypothetical protein
MMNMRRRVRGAVRRVSILAAFALAFAHVIGAYTHAAGHAHGHAHGQGHAAHAAWAHDHADHEPAAIATIAVIQQSVSADPALHGDHGTDHASCSDFVCHGGIAILVAPAFAYAELARTNPSCEIAFARLLWPSSLERPPKSPAFA